MASLTTPTYIAFFSTGGRRFPPRSVDPQNLPPPVIRSDEKQDMDKMIKRLRGQWPHQCNGIFAKSSEGHKQWHLHWFFDEYDFYVHGGEFLYNLLLRLQDQNQRAVIDFVTNWAKSHEQKWSMINFELMTVENAFSEPDRSLLGEEFLATCLRHIKSKFHGARVQHNENLLRGYQEYQNHMARLNNAQPEMINTISLPAAMSVGRYNQPLDLDEHHRMHLASAQGMPIISKVPGFPQPNWNDSFNHESAMAKPFLPNHQVMVDMAKGHQEGRTREWSQDDRKPTRGRGGKNAPMSRRQSLSSGNGGRVSIKDVQRGKPRGNSLIRPMPGDQCEINGGDRLRQTSQRRSEEGVDVSEIPRNSLTISATFVGHDIDYLTNVYLGKVPHDTLPMEDVYNALTKIVDVEWVSVSPAPEKGLYAPSTSYDVVFADVKTTKAVRRLLAVDTVRCLDLWLTVRTPFRLWRHGREGPSYEIPTQYRPKFACSGNGEQYAESRHTGEWRTSSAEAEPKPRVSPQDARSTLHKLPDSGTVPPDKIIEYAQTVVAPIARGGPFEPKSSTRSPLKKGRRGSSKMESIVEEKLTPSNNHEFTKTSQNLMGTDVMHGHVFNPNATADHVDAHPSESSTQIDTTSSSHDELNRKDSSDPLGKDERMTEVKEAEPPGSSLNKQEILGKDRKEDLIPRNKNKSGSKARMLKNSSALSGAPMIDLPIEVAKAGHSQDPQVPVSKVIPPRDTQMPVVPNVESHQSGSNAGVVNHGGPPQHSLTKNNLLSLGVDLGSLSLPELRILPSNSTTSTMESREAESKINANTIPDLSTVSAMAPITGPVESIASNQTTSFTIASSDVPTPASPVSKTIRKSVETEADSVELGSGKNHIEDPTSSASSFLAPSTPFERPKSSQAMHELASWTKDLDKTLEDVAKLPKDKQEPLISKAEAIKSDLLSIEQRYGDAAEKAFSSDSKKTTRKTQMKKVKQLQEVHEDKILELFALHGDCQRESAPPVEAEANQRKEKKKKAVVPEVIAEPPRYPQHHADAAVFNTRHREAQPAQQWLVIILLGEGDSKPAIILSEMQADSSVSRPAVSNNHRPQTMYIHDLSHHPERPFVSQLNSIDDIPSLTELKNMVHKESGTTPTVESHDIMSIDDIPSVTDLKNMMNKESGTTSTVENHDDTSTSDGDTSASEDDIKASPPKLTGPEALQQKKMSYASVAKGLGSRIVPALPKISANSEPEPNKETKKNGSDASEWQVLEDWTRTGGYQKKD